MGKRVKFSDRIKPFVRDILGFPSFFFHLRNLDFRE